MTSDRKKKRDNVFIFQNLKTSLKLLFKILKCLQTMKNTVKANFTISQKILLFPIALIETTFYLPASFACGRSDLGNPEEELKKNKNIIYRYGRSVYISLYGPPIR